VRDQHALSNTLCNLEVGSTGRKGQTLQAGPRDSGLLQNFSPPVRANWPAASLHWSAPPNRG